MSVKHRYRVSVRGDLPPDLDERISEMHARAVMHVLSGTAVNGENEAEDHLQVEEDDIGESNDENLP